MRPCNGRRRKMTNVDISDFYNPRHPMRNYFFNVRIENNKLHIHWKSDEYSIDKKRSFLEKDGKQWAICINIFDGPNDQKEKYETITLPKGVERIVIDRIKCKRILNGYEADVFGQNIEDFL
jgi:hypothetical protein